MSRLIVAAISEPIVVASFLVLCSVAGLILAAVVEWEPSPRARRVLEDVREALRRRDSLKAGAIDMGVAVERISRWLNPSAPNILTRLADLGEDFEREFFALRARELGLTVIDARLAAALELVDKHRRRMARAQMKETA